MQPQTLVYPGEGLSILWHDVVDIYQESVKQHETSSEIETTNATLNITAKSTDRLIKTPKKY